ALVDGVGIVLQHEMRDRVMEDLASLQVRRADFDHPHPARLVEAEYVSRRPPPTPLAPPPDPAPPRAFCPGATSRRGGAARTRRVPPASTAWSPAVSPWACRPGCL